MASLFYLGAIWCMAGENLDTKYTKRHKGEQSTQGKRLLSLVGWKCGARPTTDGHGGRRPDAAFREEKLPMASGRRLGESDTVSETMGVNGGFLHTFRG